MAFSHENGSLFESAEEHVQAQNAEIEDQDDYFTVRDTRWSNWQISYAKT